MRFSCNSSRMISLQFVLILLIVSQVEMRKKIKHSNLKSVFIAVSTSEKHHNSILPIAMKTWFNLAKENTWFFSNTNNEWITVSTDNHLVLTDCESCIPSTKECLCNQIQSEMMYYYDHYATKWFCHFDDTTYVNVPNLLRELRKYNHTKDWYLGRRYIAPYHEVPHEESFWFGRLAAGCCISHSLMMKLKPRVSRKNFLQNCLNLETVDQALGFVIEGEGVQLTNVPKMHDNIEDLSLIKTEDLRNQITLSFSDTNVVNVPGFNSTVDPTRLLSLHCYILLPHPIYNNDSFCVMNGYKEIISKNKQTTNPGPKFKKPKLIPKYTEPQKVVSKKQTSDSSSSPEPDMLGMFGYLF